MRKSTVILAGSLFLSATAVLWLSMRLHEEHARNAELLAQTNSWRPHETAPRPPVRLAPSITAEPASGAEAKPDSARSVKKPASGEDWRERERRLLQDPKYRAALKAQHRLGLQSWRDESVRLLGLSAAQADKVIDIYIERALDANVRPNPQNEAEMKQRMREIERARYEKDDAVAEILGDAKAAEWQQYMASQPSRAEVRQLGAQLLTTTEPLREEQIEPLVAALTTEREQLTKEMNDYYVSLDWSESGKADSEARYSTFVEERAAAASDREGFAASGILSQTQLNTFLSIRQRQVELNEAQQRLYRTRSQAKRGSSSKSN